VKFRMRKPNKKIKIDSITKIFLLLIIFLVSELYNIPKTNAESSQIQSPNSIQLSNKENIIGKQFVHIATNKDTLLDLARQNGLGFIDIAAANQGVDPWVPGEGSKITLPTTYILPPKPRSGLIINLGEHRLYLFNPTGDLIKTFPIGVGKEGWETPLGSTQVIRKQANPIWFPPESIRKMNPDLPKVVRPGHNNPLGTHAIYFSMDGYLLHGTNKPWGVGRRVSHGCIRLYPEDIKELYFLVDIGTPVSIINQPIKVAWHKGSLYIEAHPDAKQSDHLEAEGKLKESEISLADTYFRLSQDIGESSERLDWELVRKTLQKRKGIPTKVTK